MPITTTDTPKRMKKPRRQSLRLRPMSVMIQPRSLPHGKQPVRDSSHKTSSVNSEPSLARRLRSANVLAPGVLSMERREHTRWLEDHSRDHHRDRLLARVPRVQVVFLLNSLDDVLQREVARERDAAAGEELVECRIVEHLRHFAALR